MKELDIVITDFEMLKDGEWIPDESSINSSITMLERAKEKLKNIDNQAINFAEWIRIKDYQTSHKNNWIGLDLVYYTTEQLFDKFKQETENDR